MKIETIKASKYSYKVDKRGKAVTRNKLNVRYIVIHYTGVSGDTARGEGAYFKKNNTRYAGAHFFIDRNGNIVKSIPMNYTAWSVGGKKYPGTKGAKFYGICRNSNSVSIELCDITDKQPSDKQTAATRNLVKYIKKECPNTKYIIRHYDVTGKSCPATMISPTAWTRFKDKITS